MSPRFESLLQDVMALSPSERAELASRLIESLESRFDETVEGEWETEIALRLRDLAAVP